MHLYTDEGDIDTTANNPFYVIGKGWVAAGDLAVGNEVYNLDGTTSTILGYEIEVLDEPVLVYNLEVEDFHSYFVGCVPVLVHNVCYGNWGDGGRGSAENNSWDHFDKHGFEVGAANYEDYLKKAKNFANTVLEKKAKRYPIDGYTDNVYRYRYNGKYIDLYFNGTEHLIISYGINKTGLY